MELIYEETVLNPFILFAVIVSIVTIISFYYAIKTIFYWNDIGIGIFLLMITLGLGIGAYFSWRYTVNNPLTYQYVRFNEPVDLKELYEKYKEVTPFKGDIFRLLVE